MSNNRMFLKNIRTGNSIMLAKYYPSTGWCFRSTAKKIDALFKASEPEPTQWGDNDWIIEYEHTKDEADEIQSENTIEATVLSKKWMFVDAGSEEGITLKCEDSSIFTVDGEEVIGASEWLRCEKQTLLHIVELHNATIKPEDL